MSCLPSGPGGSSPRSAVLTSQPFLGGDGLGAGSGSASGKSRFAGVHSMGGCCSSWLCSPVRYSVG